MFPITVAETLDRYHYVLKPREQNHVPLHGDYHEQFQADSASDVLCTAILR